MVEFVVFVVVAVIIGIAILIPVKYEHKKKKEEERRKNEQRQYEVPIISEAERQAAELDQKKIGFRNSPMVQKWADNLWSKVTSTLVEKFHECQKNIRNQGIKLKASCCVYESRIYLGIYERKYGNTYSRDSVSSSSIDFHGLGLENLENVRARKALAEVIRDAFSKKIRNEMLAKKLNDCEIYTGEVREWHDEYGENYHYEFDIIFDIKNDKFEPYEKW